MIESRSSVFWDSTVGRTSFRCHLFSGQWQGMVAGTGSKWAQSHSPKGTKWCTNGTGWLTSEHHSLPDEHRKMTRSLGSGRNRTTKTVDDDWVPTRHMAEAISQNIRIWLTVSSAWTSNMENVLTDTQLFCWQCLTQYRANLPKIAWRRRLWMESKSQEQCWTSCHDYSSIMFCTWENVYVSNDLDSISCTVMRMSWLNDELKVLSLH